MGFSEEFINNAAAEVTSRTVQADYEFIEKKLREAVVNTAQSLMYFDPKDVVIYLQGSYACKTNTKFQLPTWAGNMCGRTSGTSPMTLCR